MRDGFSEARGGVEVRLCKSWRTITSFTRGGIVTFCLITACVALWLVQHSMISTSFLLSSFLSCLPSSLPFSKSLAWVLSIRWGFGFFSQEMFFLASTGDVWVVVDEFTDRIKEACLFFISHLPASEREPLNWWYLGSFFWSAFSSK